MAAPLIADAPATTRKGSLRLYTVDAFSPKPFGGNPAAVVLDTTNEGLEAETMQLIAAEMNISETAYIRPVSPLDTFETGSLFDLRWFTPVKEVPLCGHATLASAAVLFYCIGNTSTELQFITLSGVLKAARTGEFISLDLPLNTPQPQDPVEFESLLELVTSLDTIQDVQLSTATRKLLVRVKDGTSRKEIEELRPVLEQFTQRHDGSKVRGVIVTTKGNIQGGHVDHNGRPYDFVSRYFAPWVGIPEDPVTGSAHTVLAGYWSKQLGKQQLYARQCSKRAGDVQMMLKPDNRVQVAGPATIIVRGTIAL